MTELNHIFLKPRIIKRERRKINGKWVWLEYEETIPE